MTTVQNDWRNEMTEEKQIEELINDITDIDDNGYAYNEDGYEINGYANARKIATELVKYKGYRKQSVGEWIVQDDDNGFDFYQCSKCYREVVSTSNYCSHCGAKMKGGE